MIVVLPFCSKDKHLALLNLELCRKLDGKVEFDCLVSSEVREDPKEVVAAAQTYFRKVFLSQYPKCPWGPKWPGPQNWAWQQAARAVQQVRNEPWLWWEADAVPLRPGWLRAIADAYPATGSKVFAGTVVRNGVTPQPYMAGVGVYPSQIQLHASTALNAAGIPFDVCLSTVDQILPKVKDISELIQHEFRADGGGWKRGDPLPDATLYHRCKDGSLHRDIGSLVACDRRQVPELLTVVITSHNRLGRLQRALKSCLEAGIRKVVVTATGYGRDTEGIKALEQGGVAVLVNAVEDSNQAWIAGVRLAATPWVHILHDDDMLLPCFSEIERHLNDSFILFPARFHHDSASPTYLCDTPAIPRGEVSCDLLLNAIRAKGSLSITPVRGIFRRKDVLEWLEEAGRLLPKKCYLRPDFLVGNDYWLWLAAASKYGTFYSHPIPMVSLGCDPDSTTSSECTNKSKRLERIYDLTKDTFFSASRPPRKADVSACSRLHVLTIVLDGAPWLMGQLQVLNRLHLDWHWSIVEGSAKPMHCTSWCKGIPPRLSLDGTSQILADLTHHRRVTIYSQAEWQGKVEMVNRPLLGRDGEEILLQLDVDEFWEAKQLEEMVRLFDEHRERSHAMFWCRFFVGPGIVMADRNCYANNPGQDWRRAWRRKEGQVFLTHEPPVMSGDQSVFFTHAETEARGLIFDHYAYALSSQVSFKEVYYGYADALGHWNRLQNAPNGSVLGKYFPWADDVGKVAVV